MLESWQEAMNLDQDPVTYFYAGILSNDVHARILCKIPWQISMPESWARSQQS